jgi:hypothetical protein
LLRSSKSCVGSSATTNALKVEHELLKKKPSSSLQNERRDLRFHRALPSAVLDRADRTVQSSHVTRRHYTSAKLREIRRPQAGSSYSRVPIAPTNSKMVALRSHRHIPRTRAYVGVTDHRGIHSGHYFCQPWIRPIAVAVRGKSGLVGCDRNWRVESMGSMAIREVKKNRTPS